MALERLCAKHGILMPKVSYDVRGKCAGLSLDGQNHISFNLYLFREKNCDLTH